MLKEIKKIDSGEQKDQGLSTNEIREILDAVGEINRLLKDGAIGIKASTDNKDKDKNTAFIDGTFDEIIYETGKDEGKEKTDVMIERSVVGYGAVLGLPGKFSCVGNRISWMEESNILKGNLILEKLSLVRDYLDYSKIKTPSIEEITKIATEINVKFKHRPEEKKTKINFEVKLISGDNINIDRKMKYSCLATDKDPSAFALGVKMKVDKNNLYQIVYIFKNSKFEMFFKQDDRVNLQPLENFGSDISILEVSRAIKSINSCVGIATFPEIDERKFWEDFEYGGNSDYWEDGETSLGIKK